MKAVPQSRAPDQTMHGIDRMIRNVETGRFERSLSALTAAGALITLWRPSLWSRGGFARLVR
jgi:hypothetical protein